MKVTKRKRMNYENLVERTHGAESIYERYIRTIGLKMFSDAEESLAEFLSVKYRMPVYILTLDEIHRSTEQFKKSDRGKHLFRENKEKR